MWAGLGNKILSIFLGLVVEKLLALGLWVANKVKRDKTNKDNVKDYEDKLQHGTDEERIDSATDMLNGK